MRVVILAELLQMKPGVIYSHFAEDQVPCFHSEKYVFCGALNGDPNSNDFVYYQIGANYSDAGDSDKFFDLNDQSTKVDEVKLTSKETFRWGLHDKAAKFVVFSDDDVKGRMSDLAPALVASSTGDLDLSTAPEMVIRLNKPITADYVGDETDLREGMLRSVILD